MIDRAALLAFMNEIGLEGPAGDIYSVKLAEKLLEAVFADPDIKDRLFRPSAAAKRPRLPQ